MTENILIEFSSDTKGITTAEAALQEFANADKAIQDQFTKTNASLKERDKVLSNLQGGLGELTTKLQNAEKAAVGAFGTKGLNDFRKGITENTNLTKLLTVSVGAAGEKLKTLGTGTAEYKQLNAEIQKGIGLIKRLTVEEELAGESRTNLLQGIGSSSLTGDLLGFAAGAAGFQGISAFFQGTIDEANQAEQATVRFKNALENIGRIDVFDRLSKKADEFAATFRFIDNDNVTEVFQQLISYGKLTEKQITDLTPVIINFAAKAGITINESASLIIKALEGNARALKDYGVSLKDGKDATERLGIVMAELKPKVEGAAAAFGETFAGQVAIAKQDIANLQEEIGGQLTPVLAKFYQSVYYAITGIKSIFSTVGDVFTNTYGALKLGAGVLKDIFTLDFTNIDKRIKKVQDEQDATEKSIATQKELADARKEADSVAKDAASQPLKVQQELLKQNLALKDASFKNYNDLVAAGKQFTAEGHAAAMQLYTDNQVVLALQKTIAQSKDTSILGSGDPDDKTTKHVKGISDAIKELRKDLATLQNEQIIGTITPKQADIERVKAYDKAFKEIFDLGANADTPIVKKLTLELDPINQRVLEQQIHDLVAKMPHIEDKILAPSDNSAALKALIVKNATEAMQKFTDNASALYTQDLANEKARYDKGEISYEEYLKRLAFHKEQYDQAQLGNQIQLDQGLVISLKKQGLDTTEIERRLNEERQKYYQQDVKNKTDAEKDKTKAEQEEATKRQQIEEAATLLFNSLSSGYFDSLSASYQNDLSEVQDLQNKKLISQQEADKRIRQIHREQAVLDKEQALFNIAIQTAENIVKYIGNPIAEALAITAGIVQTAFVASRPLPKYRKGKIRIDGPGTEESDSIFAMLSKNESVINAAGSNKMIKQYPGALEAINNLQFDQYLSAQLAKFTPKMLEMPVMNFPSFQMPTMNALPEGALMKVNNSSPIDYKLLAHEVGIEVAKKVGKVTDIAGVDVRIDKDGIIIIAKEGIDRTEFVNRKYSFSTKK